MATTRDQIEHFEASWKDKEKPWRQLSHSRKYLKRQINKLMRRINKNIDEDDVGGKTNRKPTKGWEY